MQRKDWRSWAGFRVEDLAGIILTVLRVDYWGQLKVEELLPQEAHTGRHGYLLIHQAHVRLLLRPEGLTHEAFLRSLGEAGIPVETLHTVGWEAMLDAAPAVPSVTAKEAGRCQRCAGTPRWSLVDAHLRWTLEKVAELGTRPMGWTEAFTPRQAGKVAGVARALGELPEELAVERPEEWPEEQTQPKTRRRARRSSRGARTSATHRHPSLS